MLPLAKYFTAKPLCGQYAGSKRKHLTNYCVAMGPSERFDYIVSIFSEGSLRRFSDYLDVDISMMTIHSAKGSSGTLFSFRALRVLIGLE